MADFVVAGFAFEPMDLPDAACAVGCAGEPDFLLLGASAVLDFDGFAEAGAELTKAAVEADSAAAVLGPEPCESVDDFIEEDSMEGSDMDLGLEYTNEELSEAGLEPWRVTSSALPSSIVPVAFGEAEVPLWPDTAEELRGIRVAEPLRHRGVAFERRRPGVTAF